jgi:hypothetical protein
VERAPFAVVAWRRMLLVMKSKPYMRSFEAYVAFPYSVSLLLFAAPNRVYTVPHEQQPPLSPAAFPIRALLDLQER